MTKTELVDAVAKKAGLTKAQAKEAVDATVEIISASLAKEEKVAIIGFGAFTVVERKERTGINPRTKETITIPACKQVRFKPGMELAEKVK